WNDGSTKVIENPTLNQYLVVQNVMDYTQLENKEEVTNEDTSQSSKILPGAILASIVIFVIFTIFFSRKSN
ncbi:MAG: hypothetical protein CMA30_07680, partial [Euryarchaeota archaeon]|nr:hypothetical protein [Euryarchaeota archaeon]